MNYNHQSKMVPNPEEVESHKGKKPSLANLGKFSTESGQFTLTDAEVAFVTKHFVLMHALR